MCKICSNFAAQNHMTCTLCNTHAEGDIKIEIYKYRKIMRIISTIISLCMIGTGIAGLALTKGETYWWIVLATGIFWLIIDITTKKNR